MEAQVVRRDKPDSYARYMRANPLYFEGLWRVEFSERNLERAVRTVFPGKPFETGRKEIMGSRKTGTCSNCTRGPMTLVVDLCATCNRSAGSLTGAAREKKLVYIKEKIERGEVKPRGINAKLLRLVTADHGGAFSEKAQAALNKGVEEKARERAESGVMGKGSLPDSEAKVEAQLRGLLRLISETSKMGLATEITVSINIGGIRQ